MKEISHLSKLRATVRIPGSKSITHRAIIAASLADGGSVLRDFLECEDTLYTINALREIGVQITIKGNDLKVEGRGGSPVQVRSEKKFIWAIQVLLSVCSYQWLPLAGAIFS